MPRQLRYLLLVVLLGCSRTESIPAQPYDEFGLELAFISATEDFSSTDTVVQTSKHGNSITYRVSHVSGCGYSPASPKYELARDNLALSYVLRTDMDELPASPCQFTSEFRFSQDPGAKMVVFNVRPE